MKTLLLLRHAKSNWDDPDLKDFDRPLNKRGLKDAPLIGKFIRKKKIRPDLVISSPAERAKQTIALVLKSAKLEVEPRFDERLYEATTRRLFKVISEIEDSADTVMLVGHNPGFEELLEALTGEARQMPTAALACIEADVDNWSKVRAGSGQLKTKVTPRKLRD